jgi:hypothetical protein
LCTEKADTLASFTDVTVPLPANRQAMPVRMEAGDVLFFNGSLVHGSRPNESTRRFRRSLIGHYILADAKQVAAYYHPALRMDGTQLELDVSEGGGACGEWTEHKRRPGGGHVGAAGGVAKTRIALPAWLLASVTPRPRLDTAPVVVVAFK